MTDRQITFEVYIRASPEKVWRSLTDPAEIPKWSYPIAVELDSLKVGGTYRFKDKQGPDDLAEIIALEPFRRLAYRWTSSEPEPTIVEYILEPAGPYTKLTFRNGPFKEGPEWDRFYPANFTGWLDFTLKLRTLVENP
jgi:uncharacterized protein YndB with AHSA1/START domain